MLIKNNTLLSQKPFQNEKELQNFFEVNLKTILNLTFIDTEFIVGQYRLDTLAYNEETNSFYIIEFKNIKNHSLVDQGFAYLKLMLERKADFVLHYNNKLEKNATVESIDWEQSRIVFVSTTFTQYQLDAANFKNAFDLVKVTRYENDIVDIDPIKKTSSTKIESTLINPENNRIAKEIEIYDEDYHLNKVTETTKELYEELKNRILELGDIDIDPKKMYIAFKGKTNIVDITFTKTIDKLNVMLNLKKGHLDDPEGITKDATQFGHWGNGDYRIVISSPEDIDRAMPLIRQSFEVNKK